MRIVGPYRLALAAFVALGAIWGTALPAWAVIDYGNGTTGTRVFTSPVPALANYEANWGSFLATPISTYYFISAKHINGPFGYDVGSTFTINSQNFTVTGQYDSPTSDLTVWEINPNTTGFSSGNIAPLYPLYPNSNMELNKSMVVTGRGTDVGAQVLVGATLKGWQWGTYDGQQSWGTNTVSEVLLNAGTGLGQMLRYSFDSSGGSNEGALSLGDSGGGLFIQDPTDSVWKLAGINFGAQGPFSLSSDGSNSFSAAIFDRSGLYRLDTGGWVGGETGGASSYSTRIAGNLTWINSITGSPIWKGTAGGNWSSATNWSSSPGADSNLVFSGSNQTSTNNDSLTSVGSITFDGTAISRSLGGNALTIKRGLTNFSGTTQTVNLNLTLSAAQQFNAAKGNLVVNGTVANGGNALTVSGASNTTLAGAVSGTGALVKSGSGTLTVTANNSYGGGTAVNDGTLVVGHVHALGSGGLSINNTSKATLQANLSAPVQLPSLTIQGNTGPVATLDITNDNLIVHNGNLATLTAQVKSGLNFSGTRWTGAGITSSTAAADSNQITAVGVIPNNINGNPIYSTWPVGADSGGAVSVTTTDVLIKYTYSGDANLDGVVDADFDYALWNLGFSSDGGVSGWLWGDFDYSGTIDVDTDYALWNLAFSEQTPGNGLGGGVQPVPEPSTLLLAGVGICGIGAMLRRRRSTQA